MAGEVSIYFLVHLLEDWRIIGIVECARFATMNGISKISNDLNELVIPNVQTSE